MKHKSAVFGTALSLVASAASGQAPYAGQVPYGGAGIGVDPRYGMGGYAPPAYPNPGYPAGPNGYAPGPYATPGSIPNPYGTGYMPPGMPYGQGGVPYSPNIGYGGQAGPYGPPPAGALDLNAPGFNDGNGSAINDPAFGPAVPNQSSFRSRMVPPPAYSPYIQPHRTMSVRDYGQTFIDPPRQRTINLHDIITVLVDEKAELLIQNRYNRQRNLTFNAQLKQFLRIDDDGNLAPAVQDGAAINASLRSRLQSDGTTTDREGIRYRIAATVVGVLPNGNIVLEARKLIRSSDGEWEYTLTGTIASRDVKNDYTALSENVANLQIEKTQSGKTADAAQRPWGMWLYDKLSPF